MGNSPEVNRRYYQANKERQVARNKAYRARNWTFVKEIKEQTPCADCKVNYPHYVMDFDHIGDDKVADISVLCARAASLEKIQAEIDKCELVCSNCHRIRTFTRKLTGSEESV